VSTADFLPTSQQSGGPAASERALVLAPTGRDSTLAAALLKEAGIEAQAVASVAGLIAALDQGAGLAVVAEEAFRGADLNALAALLAAQPPWSDFPFVLLTGRGGGPERNPAAAQLWGVLGNVSFLERPFHPTTLVSVARAALRGRRRQYEARARLEEVRRAEEALRRANETLEERVIARTRALREEMAERERVEAQLRQSQKVEAIGQLTGGVAHDFNNLLMAVLGNLALLKKRLPVDDPRIARLLEGAQQGAQRGAALTHRLLAFARRQDLRPEAVDLAALVEGMAELLRRSLGPLVELRIEAARGLPPALADSNQIELALLNLAVNARDAMPGGGRLSITLDRAPTEASVTSHTGAGRYLRLRVSDTGAGMDEATLARAVEPFFSTKPVGQGTGLGLSMVHGVARQLGGDLRLTSLPGTGTVAEILLPAAPRPRPVPAGDAPRAAAGPAGATPPSRILVVDDDALIARSTTDMLEDLGHTVVEADSAALALAMLESDPRVDVLITDFAMPGMTGLELALAARRLRPGLPVVLASGFADLPEGAVPAELPRLAKPYGQAQLARSIAQALANGRAG
jgi:signal transduction histidine kinase